MLTPIQLQSKDIAEIREDILSNDQEGLCAICGNVPKRPCLDHEHKKRIKGSGLVRGVLCSSCNIFLAKSENNCVRYAIGIKDLPNILRRMADYIEEEHYPYIHPSEKEKLPKLKKASYNRLVKLFSPRVLPDYPKSGKLTVTLERLFKEVGLTPEFYKK